MARLKRRPGAKALFELALIQGPEGPCSLRVALRARKCKFHLPPKKRWMNPLPTVVLLGWFASLKVDGEGLLSRRRPALHCAWFYLPALSFGRGFEIARFALGRESSSL